MKFIECLAQISNHYDIEFAIDGSVARNFTLKNNDHEKPLEKLVPALSDIDFFINPDHSNNFTELKALVKHHAPESNFYHLESILDYYPKTSLKVTNPKIWFTPTNSSKDMQNLQNAKAVFSLNHTKQLELVFENSDTLPKYELRAEESIKETSIHDLILDLAYMTMRNQEHPSSECSRLMDVIYENVISRDERPIFWEFSLKKTRRLKMILLKIILNNTNMIDGNNYRRKLYKILSNFEYQFLDRLLFSLVNYLNVPTPNLKAIVRPTYANGRWVREVYQVETYNPEILSDIQLQIFEGFEDKHKFVPTTPILNIPIEQPVDPSCCQYSDFSRNVLEIAFSNTPNQPYINHGVIAVNEKQNSFAFAHNVVSENKVSSFKLDYGYLCWLANKNHSINVLGVAEKDG